ncbi:MAG: transporter substrate-binding domain-containing protein, partial [Eubacterium sp.]|nr:transporter substrate-binding domain-containing protein [Eubacterium sp.]
MKRRVSLFFACILLSLTVSVPIVQAAEFSTFDELSGKTIAMLTGAPFEELISSKVPDVGEFQYFASLPDMQLALRSGKIDAFFMNSAIAALISNNNDDLAVLPENLGEAPFGFAFTKGSPERDEWQAAFNEIDPSEIEAAWEKWTGADNSIKTIPEQDWPGKNGEVKVAACDTLEPMAYAGDDGKLLGFDIDVILMIAKKLDKHVKFTGMEFAS